MKNLKESFLYIVTTIILLMVGINVEALTVIYPPGKEWAEPGDVVTVVFDNDVNGFKYRTDSFNTCYHRNMKGIITGNQYIDSGDECQYLSSNITASRVSGSKNIVKFTVPIDYNESVLSIHYGTSTETNEWYNFLFINSVTRNKKYGKFNIRVFTGKPSVYSNADCFCPGNEIILDIENFYMAERFKVSCTDKHGDIVSESLAEVLEFDPTKGSGQIKWVVPDVDSDIEIAVQSNDVIAKTRLNMCEPKLVNVPDCVEEGTYFDFLIENACPTAIYSIQGLGETKTFTGSDSYTVTASVPLFDKAEENGTVEYYKLFQLVKDGEVIASYNLDRCESDKLVFYSGNSITLARGKCFAGESEVKKLVKVVRTCTSSWSHWSHTDYNGYDDVTREASFSLQYREVGEATFKDVLSDTKFYSGTSYIIRTLLYENNQFVKYKDSDPITIVPNSGAGSLYTIKIKAPSEGRIIAKLEDGHVETAQNKTVTFTAKCGSKITFTAEPVAKCNAFLKWNNTVSSYGGTDLIYPATFEIVAIEDQSFQAFFKQRDFTINALPNDANKGSVSITQNNNAVQSGSKVSCWNSVKLKATPKAGSLFVGWSDGNKQAERELTVSADVALIAIFEEIIPTNLSCNSANCDQEVCVGQAINPITLESSSSKIKDVSLPAGLTATHVAVAHKGDAIKITGTPTAEGVISLHYEVKEGAEANGDGAVDVKISVIGGPKITCKEYRVISKDGKLSFPLTDLVEGAADEWTLGSTNFTLKNGVVTGTAVVGSTTTVNVSGKKCEKTATCAAKIVVMQQVDACE